MTDRDDGRLPRAAEAMLRGWPAPPRQDAFWEDRTDAVLAEVRRGEPAGTPDELLDPPLPAEPGERSHGEWMRSAPAARPSVRPAIRLADLARSTVENDGEEDRLAVAKQTLSHAVRARVQVAAVATGPKRPANEEEEAEELTEADEIEEPARAAVVRRPRRRKRFNAPLVVGSTVGFLGFAAAALIVLYTIQHPVVGQLAALVGVTLPPLGAQAPAPPESPQPVVVAAAPEKPRPSKPSQAAAPSAGQRPTEAKPGSEASQAVAMAPRAASRASAPKSEASKSSEAAEEVAVNEEPEPPPPAAAPEPEPKQPEPKKPEPETYSDRLPPAQDESRPLEPSTGAAMSAIQSVMPNARACLVGRSAPSSATVTFGSDGRVKSVTVSGPPANSEAASCIRVALSSARVSPFAKPSFSIPATVRPP